MNSTIKIGLIITSLLTVSFLAGGVLGYWYGHSSNPYKPPVSDNDPVRVTPITQTTSTGLPFLMKVSDIEYYDDYASFVVESNDAGKAKIEIDRPDIWNIPNHIFSMGIGGGYYCGHWLPGGSLGHYWRIGSIKKLNFYMGPDLSISAYNKIDKEIPVAVSIQARLLITY